MSTDARYLPPPPKRSLFARVFAVAVLAAVVIALLLVVSKSLSIDDDSAGGTVAERSDEETGGRGIPDTYTVQEGESLSTIAEKFGISTKAIERNNPDIDPNTLATGTVIKLH